MDSVSVSSVKRNSVSMGQDFVVVGNVGRLSAKRQGSIVISP